MKEQCTLRFGNYLTIGLCNLSLNLGLFIADSVLIPYQKIFYPKKIINH